MSPNIIQSNIHSDKPNTKVAYSDKKQERIIDAYRTAEGNMTVTSEISGIPRTTLYDLLKQEDSLRSALDLVDEEDLQERKREALEKLGENVQDKSQRAIEYTLEKDPRHRRGKIIVNKSAMDKLKHMGLILGFEEEPEIE